MKINFLCIGTQKAGTTTLFRILKQHPNICLPRRKEAHYFDNNERYQNGLDWYYEKYFNDYDNEDIIGSITPDYSFFHNVPKRIFNDLGSDIKFIFILRHPVERAVSHYNMIRGRLVEELSIKEAFEIEDERIIRGDFEYNNFSYLNRGKYLSQIKRYLKYYSINNFLFLEFEKDIVNDISSAILKIEKFLGIPQIQFKTNIHGNKSFRYRSNSFTRYLLNKGSRQIKFTRFIPSRLKKGLGKMILNLNKLENKNQYKLSKDELGECFNKYFRNEMDELADITKLDLKHWDYS